jgi:hypothetical protein
MLVKKITGMGVEGGGLCLHGGTTVSRNLADGTKKNHETPQPG